MSASKLVEQKATMQVEDKVSLPPREQEKVLSRSDDNEGLSPSSSIGSARSTPLSKTPSFGAQSFGEERYFQNAGEGVFRVPLPLPFPGLQEVAVGDSPARSKSPVASPVAGVDASSMPKKGLQTFGHSSQLPTPLDGEYEPSFEVQEQGCFAPESLYPVDKLLINRHAAAVGFRKEMPSAAPALPLGRPHNGDFHSAAYLSVADMMSEDEVHPRETSKSSKECTI
eukprot:TRINITY_DN20008_c0_g1_i3.p1 TRINITY_DN20008_c0_g1~~TRINITY_DN20008_c0_g1_i3.p1  ORF type:complete len:226 (+),score=48.05 TRINITY_DN20008_c0_g1_i3:352-1029(+)